MTQFGGIQFNHSPTHIYLPNTKAFSKTAYDSDKKSLGTQTMDFSNIASASVYPNSNLGNEGWAKADYVPHRRLDLHADAQGSFTKMFTGGFLPVYDNINETRLTNTSTAFYMFNSRKAYYHSVSSKLSNRVSDLTGHTLQGSAYKKCIEDFDAEGTASYYSVPYFSDGDNSRYMYFDLYKPGVTKKYDISAYLGTYSISELEKTENLEYNINYETGILTVSSKNNSQKSADSLVLKAKYVGESVPAVEMKIRALPALYDVSLNDKLAEVAELMESIGADISDYDPALIAKYNSLLEQKEAYEQAIKDEAANADRVAGLNNRYETVEMNFPHDAFATDNDFATTGWYIKAYDKDAGDVLLMDPASPLQYKGFNMQNYGSLSQPAPDNNTAYRASEIENVKAITKDKDGRYIFTIDGVPFKLGEIETTDGKIGANAALFRRQLKADGYTGTEPLNTVSSEYKIEGASGITSATYTLNKDGISNVNLLLSDLYVGGTLGANRFNTVTVKYTTGESVTFNSVFNKASHKFADTVFAVPVETFNDIKTNSENKYQALVDASVAFNTLVTDADADKFEGISSGTPVTLPTKTEQFVPAKRYTTYTNNYATNYMSNTVIPTDPAKTIETVTVSGALTQSGAVAEASGGFYTANSSNVQTGALMLKYDGSETIKVGEKEYVMLFSHQNLRQIFVKCFICLNGTLSQKYI